MSSCYRKANTTTITDTSGVDAPCSLITTAELFSPCCPTKGTGGANLCLSEYLCYETGPPPGGSGFLTASCTDESYANGECTQHCTDNPVPDVIYNPDTGLWACCSWTYEGGVDCANPTSETWQAAAPAVLLQAASSSISITGTALPTSSTSSSTSKSSSTSTTTGSSSSTVTSTGTSQPTSTSSSSASSSSSSSSSSGLSTGAKAGIAVGVILGVLFLALAFLLVYRRGRRARQRDYTAEMPVPPSYSSSGKQEQKWAPQQSQTNNYTNYNQPAMEMHSNSTNELPATAPRQGKGLAELQ